MGAFASGGRASNLVVGAQGVWDGDRDWAEYDVSSPTLAILNGMVVECIAFKGGACQLI